MTVHVVKHDGKETGPERGIKRRAQGSKLCSLTRITLRAGRRNEHATGVAGNGARWTTSALKFGFEIDGTRVEVVRFF